MFIGFILCKFIPKDYELNTDDMRDNDLNISNIYNNLN